MFRDIVDYFSTLSERFGNAWNRFWFTPGDPFPLAVLRVLTGLVAIYVVASYSFDLVRLFGPEGLLPVDLIDQLRGPDTAGFSYLDYATTTGELRAAHVAGLVVLVLFTVGFLTRITSIAALVVVLSYIHRAPLLTSQVEPILAMVMFYLCLGPAGAVLSIDSLLARRNAKPDLTRTDDAPDAIPRSTAAAISLRLIQVHLSVVYLMMGIAKLAGPNQTWWLGDAVWWLIVRPDTRLVDLTGLLHEHLYLINAWSHAIVLFEIAFGLLVWNRLARPLLLTIAVPMWISLALISGLATFAVMMLVANLAFVPARFLRAWFGRAPASAPADAA